MPDQEDVTNKSEFNNPPQDTTNTDNAVSQFSSTPSTADMPTESPDVSTLEPAGNPVQPSSDQTSQPPAPEPFIPDEPTKKNNKKLMIIVASVVAGIIVLVSGTVFALYVTNPEKVLLDAVQNSLKAKTVVTEGSFKAADPTSQQSITVEFSSQSDNTKLTGSLDAKVKINLDSLQLDLDAAGMVAENGDYYFKLNNAPELFEKALQSEYGKYYASDPTLTPLLAKLQIFFEKIDGQWIRVDKEDISQYAEGYEKQQECTDKAIETFYKENAQQKQVVDAYADSRFIDIEDTGKTATINGQDSIAYEISLDAEQMKAFGEEFDKTDIAKALDKCIEDTDTATTEEAKMSDSETKEMQKTLDQLKTTVWISRWGHEFQKIELENKNKKEGKVNFEMIIDTKKQPDLKSPSKYLEAADLTQELQEIYLEAFGGLSTGIDTTQI